MKKQDNRTLVGIQFVLLSITAVFIFYLGSLTASSSAVMAQTTNGTPNLISYQGYLTDDSGQPLDGTVALTFGVYAAETGGRPFWQETQPNVPINSGHFNVMLGSVTSLDATIFSDPSRYLQIGIDSGNGIVNLPRQQLTAVPYAFQAQKAAIVSWDGLTDVPSGFADGVDNSATYANRIVVAKNGGDFSSIQAAIDSINDASGESPYLVWIAPGTYSEIVTMKPFVHLQGAGEGATVISSDVSSDPDPSERQVTPTAGTLQLAPNSTLRDLTVVNTGTDYFNVALWTVDGVTDTVVENVTARTIGRSFTDNVAISLNGSRSNIILRNVTAHSENGDGSNIGLSIHGATVTLRSGTFTGRGGSHFANGIQNLGGATLVAESVIAYAEMAVGFGLLNEGSTATLHSGTFTGGDSGIYNGETVQGIPSTLFAESVMAKGAYGMTNDGTATLNGGSFTSNVAVGGRGISNGGNLQANNVFAKADARGLVNGGTATVYGGVFIAHGSGEIYGITGNTITVSHAVVEGGISVGNGSVSHTRLVNGGAGIATCTAVSQGTRFFATGCPNNP